MAKGLDVETPEGTTPTPPDERPPATEAKGTPTPDDTAPADAANTATTSSVPQKYVHKEIKFVSLVVRHPAKVFWAILSACLVVTYLLAAVVFRDGNPITDDSNTFDIYDARSVDFDSWRLADAEVARVRGAGPAPDGKNRTAARPQESLGDLTYWIFEAKDKDAGLFSSRESLGFMREAETLFQKDVDYGAYCQRRYAADGSSACARPLSALNMYYASAWNATLAGRVTEQLADDANVRLYNRIGLCVERNLYCHLLSPDSVARLPWGRRLHADIAAIARSWDGEGELNDNPGEVTLLAASLMKLLTKSNLVSFFFDENFSLDNPVSVYSRLIVYWGSPLEGFADERPSGRSSRSGGSEEAKERKRYIVDRFLTDLNDIASPGKNSGVHAYYFQTALIFDVMVNILVQDATMALISFAVIFLYLTYSLKSKFLALVGFLEILLSVPTAWFLSSAVLQIKYFPFLNALCVFIVAAIGADDIFVFMDAYRQSAALPHLDTLERRMTWVYRRSGTAMAITSATTCSAFLCTVFAPIADTQAFGVFAALVILMDYILVMTLFCTAVVIYNKKFEGTKGCCGRAKPQPVSPDLGAANPAKGPLTSGQNGGFRFLVKIVTTPRYRILLAIPFVSWVAAATVYSFRLEPTQTQEQFLAEDHPVQRAINILGSEFPSSDQDRGTKILFTWGIGPVDRSGVSQLFDPSYTGAPTFLDTFTFDETCQRHILEACESLKIDDRYEPFVKRQDSIRAVKCFVEEFGAFSSLSSLSNCTAVKGNAWRDTTWGVVPENVTGLMKDFVREPSCYGRGDILETYGRGMGWDGQSLRYASIEIESAVIDPWTTLPEEVVREQYDEFVSIANSFDATMEQACGGKVSMTDMDQKFIFMNNQKIFRTSAVSGSMIGIAIAFLVLVISTRYLHIALFATINIFCVLVSVIGFVTMIGWTLGTNEAILISILAGFSVDYVVHLAHAYVTAEGSTQERIKCAFAEMGGSVFSGMATSVLASIPLFFCNLTFFAKFGTFLCLTIAFSWLFANLFFMSLLATANIPIRKKKQA